MGIEEVLTAPRSPWQNAYVERFIGSVRRECLDHVIVLSATGLQRLMHVYCAYYEQSRTHLSLTKDAPIPARLRCLATVWSWRSRRSADFITGTNGRRPDPRLNRLPRPAKSLLADTAARADNLDQFATSLMPLSSDGRCDDDDVAISRT